MKDIDDIRRDNLCIIESEHVSTGAAAAAVGMSQAQFTNLRDGAKDSKTGKPRGMRKETARRIEKAAGKPAGWLDEPHTAHQARETDPPPYLGPDPHGPYPLISDVQAGEWTDLYDNFAPGDSDEWLPSTRNLGKHGYMLRVNGQSMSDPTGRYHFPEGMILHVNPDLTPLPGQFVIVRREGTQSATFKRYIIMDGDPYLEAINPDWPKDKKFLRLQDGDVWCGVVVDASLANLP